MVTGTSPTIAFLGAAAGNGMVVRGPLGRDAATQAAVDCAMAAAQGRRLAVPSSDPLVEELGLRGALAWAGAVLLVASDLEWRSEIGHAGVGVTGARFGIAATGTLVLPCGPGRPRGTHIIPPAHVCLVRARDLVGTIEEAVRRQAAEPHPSNVSWVSGPSRTADLEMQLTIGVHGPKRVDVIVVES
jgi:L-lactate dehydrogenase complex protein LldG